MVVNFKESGMRRSSDADFRHNWTELLLEEPLGLLPALPYLGDPEAVAGFGYPVEEDTGGPAPPG
jgi:hypothetical protein